jgi:hypothetical protein
MGSGFKSFTAASVLTAADVNDYLMEQSVMSFASTGARDVQVTAPEDGMVAYIRSNDSSEGLYHYTSASSWRKGPGWNAPWGYIQYTQVTSNVTSGNNATILTGNTISVVNNRRYRITGHVPGYFASAANNVAEVRIRVGGTDIAGSRVYTSQITSAENGCNIVAMYVATATNASLACNLFSAAIVGTNHQYLASATIPLSLLVEDIGPSGAPA